MKISKKTKIRTALTVGTFVLYGFAGKLANHYAIGRPGEKITVAEAEQIIKEEQENFYLYGRKINFVPLSGESRIPEGNVVRGFTYSSEGEFYIAINEDSIDKKLLLHEIGHVILGTPNVVEYPLEKSLESICERGDPKKRTKSKRLKYLLSPKELFCNVYALIKN